MSELISGKEALIALANGVNPSDIEGKFSAGLDSYLFISIEGKTDLCVKHINEELFRLKPRTITINGVELNQCYSVEIDYTELKVSVALRNKEDTCVLYNLLADLYSFK